MADDTITVKEMEKVSTNNYLHNLKSQLQRAVYCRSEQAFSEGDAVRDAICTRAALMRRQKMIRTALIEAIGGIPPSNTPLNIRVTGRIKGKQFNIENLIFESRPKTYVTANLYLPVGITSPRGAVLVLCGHDTEGKEAYSGVCQHLVRAGLIVLAQDPIGQGERFSYYESALGGHTVAPGVHEHDYAGTQCLPLGDGIARYFLHDAMRSMDVLCSRPEVDPKRIGVTGASGGGTQTCLMMMVDSRVRAAAPGLFVTNRRLLMYSGIAADSEQTWTGLTALGIDHEDFLLALCPKPVCVLAVSYDFFPIEGTRRTVKRCKRFWKMFGNESDLELVEDISTHSYTAELARSAARFFSRHLLGRTINIQSAERVPIDGSRLRCTKSGQVRGDFPDARAVYEENQKRLEILEKTRNSQADITRRKRACAWIRKQVISGRKHVPANLRCYRRINRVNEIIVDLGAWWSQEGVMNEGLLFRHFEYVDRRLPVTLTVWDEGTQALRQHWDWIRKRCAAGRAVLVLNVTGVAGGEPDALNAHAPHALYGVLRKLNDDLLWLNDCLCAVRTWDVLRAFRALAQWPDVTLKGLQIYTYGYNGVYAELACAIDRRLPAPEIHKPLPGYAELVMTRHYEIEDARTLILPGILRYCDLPDIRRWVIMEKQGRSQGQSIPDNKKE